MSSILFKPQCAQETTHLRGAGTRVIRTRDLLHYHVFIQCVHCSNRNVAYLTQAISRLLMSWRRMEPRHQQQCYWPLSAGPFQSQYRKDWYFLSFWPSMCTQVHFCAQAFVVRVPVRVWVMWILVILLWFWFCNVHNNGFSHYYVSLISLSSSSHDGCYYCPLIIKKKVVVLLKDVVFKLKAPITMQI